MAYTSSDVKQRYNEKTYKKIGVTLRKNTDADIVEFVEANKTRIGTTQLFREALEYYITTKK